jgi:hypothetical protein
MELFIYVLLWITRRYGKKGDKVQTIENPPFQGWQMANAVHCAGMRRASLSDPQNATPEHRATTMSSQDFVNTSVSTG